MYINLLRTSFNIIKLTLYFLNNNRKTKQQNMNIVISCLTKCACVRVCSVNHFIICTEIDLTIQIETGLPVASMQGMFIIHHKTE